MAEGATINAHDVRNLVNGNVAGDQIGGNKFGGDQVAGNKITFEIRNITFDPAIIKQLGLDNTETGISDDLRRIGQLVSSMILAELRENNSMSPNTIVGVPETRRALEEFHTLRYAGTFDTCKGSPVIKLSDILPLLVTEAPVDPKTTLRYYTLMRNIRQRKEGDTTICLRQSRRLRDWDAKSHSSLLLVKGSFASRHIVRDFTADIINELHKEKTLIAWVLKPRGEQSYTFDITGVLKHLVLQILQQSPATMNERDASLAARRVQNTYTIEDWFSFLGSIIGGLKKVYLVIDMEALAGEAQEHKWSDSFTKLFEKLQAHQTPTTVKVAFTTCRKPIMRQYQAVSETVIDADAPQTGTRLQSRFSRMTKRATSL
ncbi:hypothetical protein EYB25_009948 [Talaromyces marneffei]|uniref:uncharacterized protein n=1 Tax=Talaromyces marneffei TaxID=37727 RepID=UPI0012A8CF0A|nr:uncharacterized protein EYB26_009212 [Talaromyces marneffei]KAE8548154.1 hypothetical protein EYB25_009948 [Talaromyces marneffei]QGA21501.1 hypothetical protein EYB26_009212 [Talaromyces marneffei]